MIDNSLIFNKLYQQEIIVDTLLFRPKSEYPTYPPYHIGPYIEEYFFNYYINNNIETERIYIPIFWTNINNNTYYNNSERIYFSDFLKSLDPDKKYFTVCQHEDFRDDNNLEPNITSLKNLPKDCIIFSGSGKISDKVKNLKSIKNIISIPHVVSKIENPILNKERDIFCSFVGSMNTHPIRKELYEKYKDDEDFYFGGTELWDVSVNKEKEIEFKDIAERSVFSLCPRGNGPTSYRLYEVMQLGSIPVYIYDHKWIPWENDIKWEDVCVFINLKEISFMKTYLRNISYNRIIEMRNEINKIYDDYFTLDGVCKTIIKKLENFK